MKTNDILPLLSDIPRWVEARQNFEMEKPKTEINRGSMKISCVSKACYLIDFQ